MRVLTSLVAAVVSLATAANLELPLRTRAEGKEGSVTRSVPPDRIAVLICDMWDNHWCRGAAKRVDEMAPRMNVLLKRLRQSRIPVIHAPSDVMPFYKDYPQRKLMEALARTEPPPERTVLAPGLPIDDADGGCDTDDKMYKAWKRQHPAIEIAPEDMISDKGLEIYSLLRARGIGTLLVMGVHTNMCILNRTFAIKQMTKWGINCLLVRDMTDAMYDPRDAPFVSHPQGTELVIQYIERYWAPSVLSGDLIRGLPTQ